jgi:hypothetical protein
MNKRFKIKDFSNIYSPKNNNRRDDLKREKSPTFSKTVQVNSSTLAP